MELTHGTLINPRIRLLDELGRGAMGSVWRAQHLTLETLVAVKLIAPDRVPDDEALERFRREAKATARIKSHHVVQTLDYGITSGSTPYMVLELLEGESLAAKLARRPTMPLAEVTTVVKHVARALGSAHEVGIIHRDIKPSNIFCTRVEGAAFYKVFDFGVAKLERERRLSDPSALAGDGRQNDEDDRRPLTITGALIGTPEFMSPELMMAEPVTSSSDMWALAAVAYRCLTGELPFQGATFDALSAAVVGHQYVPPSAHVPELGAKVDGWFERAFAAPPNARFSDVHQLAASFGALDQVEAVGKTQEVREDEASTAPAASPTGRSRTKAPLMLGAVAALVAAVVLGRVWLTPELVIATPRRGASAQVGATRQNETSPNLVTASSAPQESASGRLLGKTLASAVSDGAPLSAPRSSTSSGASPPPELPDRPLGF